jgi:DNA-binding transcriptional MerR regulator/methylmalonyl-CoA mutase cobalamin-binding subunit
MGQDPRVDPARDTTLPEDPVSIGRLAEVTGISPERLRVWERRYGRPRPVRLESGHRRYPREEVLGMRRVAELLAHGQPVGEVLRLDDDELRRRHREGLRATDGFDGLDAWLDAARDYDAATLRGGLEAAARELDRLRFLDERVGPFLARIGSRWAQGALDVRHEHFSSRLVEEVLDGLRATTPPGDGERVLLANLPGEEHGIGLKMLDLAVRELGLAPTFLGPDTPIDQIARATAELEAPWVGLSVSLASGGPVALRAVRELRHALPATSRLVVGGAGIPAGSRTPRDVHVFRRLTEFADWYRGART